MTSQPQARKWLPISAEDFATIRWFIVHYARYERPLFVVTGVLLGISAAANAGLAWLIKPIFDGLIIERNPELLWVLPFGIVALVAVNGFALYGSSVTNVKIEQNLTNRIQGNLVGVLLKADTVYLDGQHTGQLIAQSMAFPGQIVMALTRTVTASAGDIAMVVMLIGVMFLRDWQLALIALVAVPLIAAGVRAINKRIYARAVANMHMMGRVGARLADLLNAIRLVKLQNTEQLENQRFADLLEDRRKIALDLARTRSMATPLFEFAGGIGIGMVVFFTAIRAATGGPSFGTLASMMGALIMAYRPLKRIAATVATIQESLVVARGLKRTLQYRPLIVERPHARALAVEAGAIGFEAVRFAYERGPDVIKDLSLDIAPGRVTALVGPSGGGKTTLINLIPRLYDVQGGRIVIDGTDIRDVTLASLRRSIAIVSQDAVFFDDTIRANIGYGYPDATDDQLAAAAEAANAAEFISELPDGYDTIIGERGVRLSGGQRQRLAIARAVLKNAPILLLDEATSSVDSRSEQLIQAEILRLMRGKTVVLVAHRLSTVVAAEAIHVVQDGRIVESGTHGQLMNRNGLYTHLYELQALENENGVG